MDNKSPDAYSRRMSQRKVAKLFGSSLDAELFVSSTKVDIKAALSIDTVVQITVLTMCLGKNVQSIKNYQPSNAGLESSTLPESSQQGYAELV